MNCESLVLSGLSNNDRTFSNSIGIQSASLNDPLSNSQCNNDVCDGIDEKTDFTDKMEYMTMNFNFFQGIPFLAGLIKSIPSPCALCHSPSRDGICNDCYHRYFSSQLPRCSKCANALPFHDPGNENLSCGNCVKKCPSYDETIVATDYEPPLDQLVHLLKFNANLAMAPLMGKLIHKAIEKKVHPVTPDYLIAVPLGKRRLVERGFNQSMEIGKTLSRSLKVDLVFDLVERNHETEKQSTISFKKRKKNVHNAFGIVEANRPLIVNSHIGIIDDVMTTGDTLEEIAALLKKAGAGRITNFVFARTPPRNLQEI